MLLVGLLRQSKVEEYRVNADPLDNLTACGVTTEQPFLRESVARYSHDDKNKNVHSPYLQSVSVNHSLNNHSIHAMMT